jgi:hypothetical protein
MKFSNQWRSQEFVSSGQFPSQIILCREQLDNLVGNHSLKTYSHYKSQYLLKRNSSSSTNKQARSFSLYYFTNVYFNFHVFEESSNMYRYQDLPTLDNCHPLATALLLTENMISIVPISKFRRHH